MRPNGPRELCLVTDLMITPVTGICLDQCMSNTRQLGSDCSSAFSTQIWVCGIFPNIASIFGRERILSLSNGAGSGKPESITKARITSFAKAIGASVITTLVCRKIEATKVQVLTVMAKSTDIAAFGDNNQSNDGSNTRYGS